MFELISFAVLSTGTYLALSVVFGSLIDQRGGGR